MILKNSNIRLLLLTLTCVILNLILTFYLFNFKNNQEKLIEKLFARQNEQHQKHLLDLGNIENGKFTEKEEYQNRIVLGPPTTTNKIEKNLIENEKIRQCFEEHALEEDFQNHELFDMFADGQKKPIQDKSIFFHETSCSEHGYLELDVRQACAIESAAKMNPNTEIFVLFASKRSYFQSSRRSEALIDALTSYPNVNFRNINLWRYANSTPASDWLKSSVLFKSKYLFSHISDFLRYVTLWRYGGTYLDLDVVVVKTLEGLRGNYSGIESVGQFIAAGVMNFEYEFADLALKKFVKSFNGQSWAANGPGIITATLKDICGTNSIANMTVENCKGFKLYPQKAFYAIQYSRWKTFFQENSFDEVMKLTNKSLIIHVWNKLSKDKKIKVGTKVAYGIYAEKFCPKVYSSCGEYF